MNTRIAEANFMANLERKLDEDADYWEAVQENIDAFNEHHCIWNNDELMTLDEMHAEFFNSQVYDEWRKSLDDAVSTAKPAIARQFNQLKHDYIQSEISALCEFIVGEKS